jgi:hypothetical protein
VTANKRLYQEISIRYFIGKFDEEALCLRNITAYFAVSSQSLLQRGFEQYYFHNTCADKYDQLFTEVALVHLTRSAEDILVAFKVTTVTTEDG